MVKHVLKTTTYFILLAIFFKINKKNNLTVKVIR